MTSQPVTADTLTAPFWQAAEQRRLVRPYCPQCDQSFFTPQVVCPHCQHGDWVWSESAGRGEIYSYTEVHRAPVAGFRTPYVLAVVDLDEGWSMLTTLVATAPEDVAIGRRVAVQWIVSADRTLPAFTVTAA